MFVPLTSTKDPNYTKRRKYVTDRVENGVAEEVRVFLSAYGRPPPRLRARMALSKIGVLRAGLEVATLTIKVFYWAEGAPFFCGKQCKLHSEAAT